MEKVAVSFSGHESFPFRNTWLTKGVRASAADPMVFTREDAMVSLGVGKNMVRSIRHWCLATGMLDEDTAVSNNRGRHLVPTCIGRRVFLGDRPWDPYLEDVATLWLIHYQLATNEGRATTFYYAFNELHEPDFTRDALERALHALATRKGVRTSANTLQRDVDVFIRTYVGSAGSAVSPEESLDCPLAELGLIFQPGPTGPYAFSHGPKDTLPDAVFLYGLWQFAQWRPSQRTLSFDEVAYAPRSPGRVFRLDETSLAERLERLADLTKGAIRFSETAGLKQILLNEGIDPLSMLDAHYQHSTPVAFRVGL